MSDAIADALRHVRTSKVEVVLSEPKVVSGIRSSGFWPRVTIEVPGKSRTFPLTDYGDVKKAEAKKGELGDIEKEVMILVSGSSRTKLNRAERRRELGGAVARIRQVIARAIDKASSKGPMAERHEAAARRYRKSEFLRKFREFCSLHGRNVEYEDVRPSDLGKVWDDVRRLKVAERVMES